MTAQSQMLGVSWRGWLAFLIIATACWCAALAIDAPDWFQALAATALGFYAGQKQAAA